MIGYQANAEHVPATSTSLGYVYGIAGNTVGDVYFAESTTVQRIRKVNSTGFINTIAG